MAKSGLTKSVLSAFTGNPIPENLTNLEIGILHAYLPKSRQKELKPHITSMAQTVDEWAEVWKKAPKRSELKRLALLRMAAKCKSFYKLFKLCGNGRRGIEHDKALIIISKRARTFANWNDLYKAGSVEVRRLATNSMTKLAKTFSHWEILCNTNPTCNNPIRIRALKGMASIASNFKEWETLGEKAKTGSRLRTKALRQMSQLAVSFDQWWGILVSTTPSSSVYNTALSGIAQLAKTFGQWSTMCDYSKAGSH